MRLGRRLGSLLRLVLRYGRKREAAGDDAEVLGPAPAFAAKRAGSYRAQIVLRGDPERVLDRVTVSNEWTVDVDPVTLLG